jgi:hypothetical protein
MDEQLLIEIDDETKQALARIANSDAAGYAHNDIYGYPIEVEWNLLGRKFIEFLKKNGYAP